MKIEIDTESKPKKFSPTDIGFVTKYNKRRVEQLRQDLANYDNDTENEKRINDAKCKYCYYMDTRTVVLNSFHTVYCQVCNTPLTFANSHTDKICKECATKYNLCCHCVAEMD